MERAGPLEPETAIESSYTRDTPHSTQASQNGHRTISHSLCSSLTVRGSKEHSAFHIPARRQMPTRDKSILQQTCRTLAVAQRFGVRLTLTDTHDDLGRHDVT